MTALSSRLTSEAEAVSVTCNGETSSIRSATPTVNGRITVMMTEMQLCLVPDVSMPPRWEDARTFRIVKRDPHNRHLMAISGSRKSSPHMHVVRLVGICMGERDAIESGAFKNQAILFRRGVVAQLCARRRFRKDDDDMALC